MTAADIRWEMAPVEPWADVAHNVRHAGDDSLTIIALSEARLRGRVDVITAERDAYRTLSQQAIHALHGVTRDRDRLRELRILERQQQRKEAA